MRDQCPPRAIRHSDFVIRHSFVIGSFVIRHWVRCPSPLGASSLGLSKFVIILILRHYPTPSS